ncbi:MAG: BMP family ABC transporter substrate-binding protein [Anaerolineae bacterium]|nr:BMP family ABC transporter substrate-binding protein [Anaerolineae bacterium]
MKRWTLLVLIAVVLFATAACSTGLTIDEQPVLNVVMLLGSGGLGDRSFNDSAYAGLQEAQRRYDIRYTTVDYAPDPENLPELRSLISQGCDLLIGIGYENAPYIETLSQEYPDRQFAVIDVSVEGDNVASVVYREQEGDFLMGILAAMLTETGRVGFIGGTDIDPIRRIESGFIQGVAYQDGSVEVVTDLAGTFSKPEVGRELALQQYNNGVDVIYNGAGRTGLGIIEAAEETGNLTIGTSGDQRYLAPGYVVGNRPKRVDTAVLVLIAELYNGEFAPGVRSLGLAEKGLSIGPFDDSLVTAGMSDRLSELEKMIVDGTLVVSVE